MNLQVRPGLSKLAFLPIVTTLMLITCSPPSYAGTPSFLCSKAKTWVEKTICGSDRLSGLDLELATVYARLLRVTSGDTEKNLTSGQRKWWSARGECSKQQDPVACLEDRYTARIAALKEHPNYTEARPGPVELAPENISVAGQGWAKSLSRYLKAIRACMRKAPGDVKVVTAGWDDDEHDQAAGVRMRGPANENWVCVAKRNGTEVISLREANNLETLPEEGPLFYPDPSTPPKGACGKPVQILDENDAPTGWLGPACNPKPAQNVTPQSGDPQGDPESAVR